MQDDVVQLRAALLAQIRDPNWFVFGERERDVRIVDTDMLLGQRADQLLVHAVGSAQSKLSRALVVAVDRASLSAGNLYRLGDDSGEHGLQVERRVDRLRDLPKRPQLGDRTAEFISALAQFVKQPRALDRDHSLCGEILHQSYLLIGKATDFLAVDADRPYQGVILK